MISICGGAYRERCFIDCFDQLYGSGGRAAFALSKLSEKVDLHTYASENSLRDLQAIASSFCVGLNTVSVSDTLSFNYFHGLADPTITPNPKFLLPHEQITVSAKNILSFGMLEGNAVVQGERVVFDPQAPGNPKWFDANGSKADKLAYVLNFSEGQLLTGKTSPSDITQIILKGGASVVVLKMGSKGTVVRTKSDIKFIPCTRTDSVLAIGTGDIFSAVFAHFWSEHCLGAIESAEKAAQATAFYCNQKSLPIPVNFLDQTAGKRYSENYDEKKILESGKIKVYLAGPFFNMSDIWLVEECRKILLSFGLDVFSPYHDVGIGTANDVAAKDIKALNESKVVFAILNGLDPGTIFEIGYAVAKGLPVIVFAQNVKDEDLKMISGTGCLIESDFVTSMYKTAWAGECL